MTTTPFVPAIAANVSSCGANGTLDECPGATVCYVGLAWAPANMSKAGWCACVSTFHYAGDDCLQATGATWLRLAFTIILLLGSGFAALCGTWFLLTRTRSIRILPIAISAVFAVTATWLIFVVHVLYVYGTLHPDAVAVPPGKRFKAFVYQDAASLLTICGICSSFTASVGLAMGWVDIAYMTQRLRTYRRTRFTNTVAVLETMHLTVVLGLIIGGYSTAGVALGLILGLACLGGYVYGYVSIVRLMRVSKDVPATSTANSAKTKLDKALGRVQIASMHVGAGIIVGLVGSASAATNGFLGEAGVGREVPNVWLRQSTANYVLPSLSILWISGALIWYCLPPRVHSSSGSPSPTTPRRHGGAAVGMEEEDEAFDKTIQAALPSDVAEVIDVQDRVAVSILNVHTLDMGPPLFTVPWFLEQSVGVLRKHLITVSVMLIVAIAAWLTLALLSIWGWGGIAFSMLMVPMCTAMACCAMSMSTLGIVVRTEFFVFRVAVAFTSCVLLGEALGDVRAGMVPGLFAVQLLAFSSDAFLQHSIRMGVVMVSLGATLVTFVLITFSFAQPSVVNEVLPIGQNGYSLLQATRDCLLGSSFVLLGEMVFLVRGRATNRFSHITFPVERVVISVDEFRPRPPRHGQDGNASSVFMASGMMVRQMSDRAGLAAATHVYVDRVAVKQNDALAFHLLPTELALRLVRHYESRLGLAMTMMTWAAGIALAAAMPLLTPTAGHVILPFSVYVLVTEPLMMSKRMLMVLMRLSVILMPVVAMMFWTVLAGLALFGQSRTSIVVHCFVIFLGDRLADANVITYTSSVVRAMMHVRSSVPIFILSMFLLLDVFPNNERTLWELRPGAAQGQSVSANSPHTLDLQQQAGDLGVATVFLPSLWALLAFAWRVGRPRTFQFITGPIMPRRVVGGGSSMSTGTGSTANTPQQDLEARVRAILNNDSGRGGGAVAVVVDGGGGGGGGEGESAGSPVISGRALE